jgi:hypothetical protein
MLEASRHYYTTTIPSWCPCLPPQVAHGFGNWQKYSYICLYTACQIELNKGKVTLDDAPIQLKYTHNMTLHATLRQWCFPYHQCTRSAFHWVSIFLRSSKKIPFFFSGVIKGRGCLSGHTISGTEENMQLKFGGAGDHREATVQQQQPQLDI